MAKAIEAAPVNVPICPVYQNVTASPVTDPAEIKKNLVAQLTSPVRWTQTMQNMIANGLTEIVEVGPGAVLQGLMRKINRDITATAAQNEL